ncbi:TrkH family potassium uptake protein [Teichococcus coralli]|uniref:TrkH family potassium uptake protein n=1 Tax=Teichococcus coralli TaxID=2545983 RepID=UPI001F21A1CC|nr:potassium transporter TrkG [Pseudoroseomonas coralli]
MPRTLQHPARLVPLAFLLVILLGTALLMLPAARAAGSGAPFLTALFTATSAVCVTGLVVQDTPTYWSGFGQAVILGLFQIGGFGIMSGATLLGLLVTRRLRLGTRLIAQAETRSLELGDVVTVLRLVLVVTVGMELATGAALAARLHLTYGEAAGEAVWHGLFLAVSAFNNAGFSVYSDSVMRFALDPLILGPIMAAVILGGIGFPVLHELRRAPLWPARWSLHSKLTLWGTAVLLLGGTAAILAYEWSNPATLGSFGLAGRLLNAAFHATILRTAGFNALDPGAMRQETFLISYALMLIGGGSASTAGGVKVTTLLVLALVVWAEIRGEPDATAFGRRVSREVQRQALTVVLLTAILVGVAALALLSVTAFPLRDVLFEVISASATVGLSTGITGDLPPAGQAIVISLMFLGRVGTTTVAVGLALRSHQRPYRYPEERPIVG